MRESAENAFPSLLSASLSCRSGLSWAQLTWLGLSAFGLVFALWAAPIPTTEILAVLLFSLLMAMLIFRLVLSVYGARLRSEPTGPVLAAEGLYPIYSILVPLFDEAPIVDQLASALAALNWPHDRLDIQLLLEAEDQVTRDAVAEADFPESTRVSLVSPGGPRTKPNALNHGLRRAEGTYVCVFDAEDCPAPDQLIEAHAVFSEAPKTMVALQAPLVGLVSQAGWIERQWQLEYAVDFGLIKPALASLGLPLPLGGSSNHFRMDALRAVGGWDAWNVTEDADLGLRFARLGYQVGMLSSPTFEMAPDRFSVWLAQRSRWIKGFIMTWVVLMRRPSLLLRQIGVCRFAALQLTFGASVLTPFLYGPASIMVLLTLWHDRLRLGAAGWVLLVFGLGVALVSALLAPRLRGVVPLLAISSQAFYWPLHTIAALRAVWDLYRRPWYWAKTPHRPRTSGDRSCSTGSSASASPLY